MGLKRKQMLVRQKAFVVQELKDRRSFLSGKGVKSPKADRDTIVRKMLADIRAVDSRLRLIADNDKRTEDMAKIKAERAAAPRKEQKGKEQKGGKDVHAKKTPEEGKGKKIKAEKKTAPSKAPEGQKAPEGPVKAEK